MNIGDYLKGIIKEVKHNKSLCGECEYMEMLSVQLAC